MCYQPAQVRPPASSSGMRYNESKAYLRTRLHAISTINKRTLIFEPGIAASFSVPIIQLRVGSADRCRGAAFTLIRAPREQNKKTESISQNLPDCFFFIPSILSYKQKTNSYRRLPSSCTTGCLPVNGSTASDKSCDEISVIGAPKYGTIFREAFQEILSPCIKNTKVSKISKFTRPKRFNEELVKPRCISDIKG